ncbi:iron ABC transporter permease [Clostridium sp. MSJ-11]|uniref:Iron ABC transporter permease n=1 Tax=Clostridium mobile TaxID=2841512 RepID=A0ABS6EHE0_9CLOT|nr:iron ABC transporter permease [Clostridium mobile]MBU5484635.1 iron ABC transporter permease [Clostridium mobile]
MPVKITKESSAASISTSSILESIRKNKIVFCGILISLSVALVISIALSVALGSVKIDIAEVYKIIINNVFNINEEAASGPLYEIIWNVRLPRVLLGAIVGAGLSIVGVAMQALVKNPLADPYILGVSSGASVGATMVILFGSFGLMKNSSLGLAAFIGALISCVCVYTVSSIGGGITPTKLILSGTAIAAICSSLTSFIIFSSKDEQGIRTVMFWLMGSLAGARWEKLKIPFLVLILCLIILLVMHRILNIMLMGDTSAVILGVNIKHGRKIILVITSLLTGTVVSAAGSIGFIGLMVPHVSRGLVGSDHKKVLPVSALLGAIFTLWADVIARTLVAPEEMPIGIITSMCGAPFFLFLMCKGSYSFGGN